jgi:hypothetical protein
MDVPIRVSRNLSVKLCIVCDHISRKFTNQTIVFDTIAGALRLSNKYDIAELHQWSTRQLFLRWPQDLTKMTYTAFPHAAGKPPFYPVDRSKMCSRGHTPRTRM